MRQLFIILILAVLPQTMLSQQSLDLSGEWEVTIGQEKQRITLPNTLDGAGIGEANQLTPMLQKPQLSRLTRKHSFIGTATYKREIIIPEEMANKPLQIFLERVMWRSQLAIDGQDIGQKQESLISPHLFSLINGLTAGKHTLILTINNEKQYDISMDNLAHSYTNDTQIIWNGVLGKMAMYVTPTISDVQVFPNIDKQQIRIIVKGTAAASFTLDGQEVHPVEQSSNNSSSTIEYLLPIKNMKLWNEFTPHLYTLVVSAGVQKKTISFGMRTITTKGNKLLINNQQTFLRGTLECCIFPLTGTPPIDESGWVKVFSTAREYGLNHIRFHSWCPPDAAFRVADQMGFYCQVELPHWSLNVNIDPETSQFLYSEFEKIIQNYGNHPSLCIISCGNELQPDFTFLNEMTRTMKQKDPRHLYVTSTFTFEKGHGRVQEPQDDLFITQWTDHGWVRGQGIFDERAPDFKSDYREALKDITVPLISHEIGQYSIYPNIHEIEKYTGILDPLNFKAIRDDLKRKGLLYKAEDYLKASGKLAVILYKEEIERAMKTPQQSGFQLLDLHDFPGQGTALVGLLDAFWDTKGLVEPQRFREFCAPVVPLARFDKAVWKNSETFTASIEIANFSGTTIDKTIKWEMKDEQEEIIAQGYGKKVCVQLGKIDQAKRLDLIVSIQDTPWRNRWNIWVYPPVKMPNDKQLLVTENMEDALKALRKGMKVLLSPKPTTLKGIEGKFLPVFWSPVHFPKQAGTMGLLCNPDHPALANFPTEMHTNWQWWNLIKRSRVMILDSIAPVTPIIESIDNFVNNRRLAQVFEAHIGKGNLVFSSIDLLTDNNLPEVRQMLYSLQTYMLSEDFHPTTVLTESELRSLFSEEEYEKKTDATSVYQ